MLVSSYGDVQTDPSAWRLAFSDVERDLARVPESGGSFTEVRDPSIAATPTVDEIGSSTRVTLRTFRMDVNTATARADGLVAPAALSGR